MRKKVENGDKGDPLKIKLHIYIHVSYGHEVYPWKYFFLISTISHAVVVGKFTCILGLKIMCFQTIRAFATFFFL